MLFIGLKLVSSQPMTLGEYNKYRGWKIPDNEDPDKPGYLVEYHNGGDSNHPDHKGYISWSPKDVFDESYFRPVGLSYNEAMVFCKRGFNIKRAHWTIENTVNNDGLLHLSKEDYNAEDWEVVA